MPSVTQGEIIDDKIITLEINYQTDFAKSSLLSLSFFRMSHTTSRFALYQNRFVSTVITTNRAD